MSQIIVPKGRYSHFVPVAVNGGLQRIPVNVATEVDTPHQAALDSAMIPYTAPPGGTLTGAIMIDVSYGPLVSISINGNTKYYVPGLAFTPTASEMDVIRNAGIPYSFIYAQYPPNALRNNQNGFVLNQSGGYVLYGVS